MKFLLSLLFSASVLTAADWSLDDAHRDKNAAEEQISLNGQWQISLDEGRSLFPSAKQLTRKEMIRKNIDGRATPPLPDPKQAENPARRWQEFLVPGVWFDTGWWSATQYEARLAPGQLSPKIRICDSLKWENKPLSAYSFAWLKREFVLPPHFQPGKSSLRFDKFNRQGWVWANGEYLGTQELENVRDFKLPATLKGGDRVELLLLVSSAVSGFELKFWAGDQVFKEAKTSKYRGISGDVRLKHRLLPELLNSVSVVPQVAQNRLSLAFTLKKPLDGVSFRADLFRDGGKLANSGTFRPIAGKDGVLTHSFPVRNLTEWTPDSPVLYDLVLTAFGKDGTLLDQSARIRFGYRELKINGKEFRFNGHPVRFRIAMPRTAMPYDTALNVFRNYKQRGFNALEIHAQSSEDNGPIAETLRAADDAGIFVFFLLPGVNNLINKWHDGVSRAGWLNTIRPIVETAQNHPSVVMWAMNMNLLGYPLDQEPAHIATDYLPPEGSYPDRNYKVAKDSELLLKSLDSSRPVYHHAGGNYGDVHTSNLYLCFSPVAEKSQWPSLWARNGKKPFIPIELGMPCDLSYFYSRESVGSGHNHETEPLYFEYGAMILGPRSYEMGTKHLERIVAMPVKPRAYRDGADSYDGMQSYFYTALRSNMIENFIETQSILSSFIREWRGYGVSGLGPWYNQSAQFKGVEHYSGGKAPAKNLKTPGYKTRFEYGFFYRETTPLYEKYLTWFAPELFFLSGCKDDETDRSTSFYSGTPIRKIVTYVNDSFSRHSRKAELRLTAPDGKTVLTQTHDLNAAPGEIIRKEVGLALPKTSIRTDFTLDLFIDGKWKDRMPITVFPEPENKWTMKRKLHLLDPVGRTRGWLKRNNVPFVEYKDGSTESGALVVIGEKALSYSAIPWKNLRKLVDGGANLIVFAQDSPALEKFPGLRSTTVSVREVFSEQENPFLAGLKTSDLSNWPGKSSFTEERPAVTRNLIPHHVWKFGNQQQVAAVILEKPHYGNFRSWTHTGFDLNYTALLEELSGAGRILYCQFDLADRSLPNPAGDLLLRNMLRVMQEKPSAKRSVVYSGGKAGRRILAAARIPYSELQNTAALPTPQSSILVIGEEKRQSARASQIMRNLGATAQGNATGLDSAQLKAWVEQGGTLLYLASNDPETWAKNLGIHAKTVSQTKLFYRPEEMIPGTGGGDFFWKDRYDLPRLNENSPYSEFKLGKGSVHFLAVDPFFFSEKEMFQRRERTRAKQLRIVSSLFTGLGAESSHGTLKLAAAGQKVAPIDLAGKWDFIIDPQELGLKKQWNSRIPEQTRQLSVPGEWEEQGVTDPNPYFKGNMPYDGYAWYFKKVFIPEEYRGLPLKLEFGAVDDFDWAWFNGVPIGRTGKETKGYWMARRLYPIPEKQIQFGQENLIAVRVFDDNNGGGIVKSPVRIQVEQNRSEPYLDSGIENRFDPYTYHRW